MKLTNIVFFAFVLMLFSCKQDQSSLERKIPNRTATEPDFFPDSSLFPIGAYYYPEHWNRSQWERDIKRMAELGFEFTHYAEFAWSAIEPNDGQYNFGWLDTCVDLAAKYGIKVVMCTPSPCPPAWLSAKFPEALTKNEAGYTSQHGTRLHANGMNDKYRPFVERIVKKMAERYGNNPTIMGWQIDNEPHFATIKDYSDNAQVRFRIWLKNKYSTISALNNAWGAAFWSMIYNDFNQISIPNNKEGGGNPHAMLDFDRFTAQELAAFLRYQAAILKQNISEKQFVTTNFAYYKFLANTDLFLNRNDLDFASHTMYLLSTYLNYPQGEQSHRLGSGMELSFSAEMAQSITGYTGIMELQPGQINWGAYNSQPMPGAVRMWLWHCFGLGDDFVCTYRFRQPIFGGELYHNGIMETDGITLQRGGREYVETINEMKKVRQLYDKNAKIPASVSSRNTAFLWSQDNLNDLINNPHTTEWNPWQHYYTYYQNLKSMGVPVTFITETDSFDVKRFPFMVAPSYQLLDANLVARWQKYVEQGGHLILSARTGQKDRNGHLWESLLQQPIWSLIGAKMEYNDQLPSSVSATITMNGKDYTWHTWGEVMTADSATEVLATYKDQFYAGRPAIVRRRIGSGDVSYSGAWSNDWDMEKDFMRNVYKDAGAEILDLPNYFFVEWRDGFYVAVNYTSNPVNAPLSSNAKIIFGEKLVHPSSVCVWSE